MLDCDDCPIYPCTQLKGVRVCHLRVSKTCELGNFSLGSINHLNLPRAAI